MSEYQLPKLLYKYNSLEPYIDAKTMRIHYTKHHKGYVDKLNKYFKNNKLKKVPLPDLQKKIKSTSSPTLRNNAGGHFNHTFFWTTMTQFKKKRDINNYPELKQAIEKKFGSMKEFYEEFEKAALSVFGSGWTWLVINKKGQLEITTTHNQDNPFMYKIKNIKHGTPILALDVWEHAYYLKYQNKRNSYIKSFFNVINWNEVNNLYFFFNLY